VEWGEEILAVIIPTNELAPPAIADITAYCRERLASFKCPRIIEFATELPRTSSGKLLKRDLRDQYTTNLVE